MTTWKNWGRTAACEAVRQYSPNSESEIAGIVKSATERGAHVKPVGSGHSFADIACTNGIMLRFNRMKRLRFVDETSGVIEAEPGVTINQINAFLARHGRALPNLGDIAYQTFVGATATGTHGSGISHGPLHTNVLGLTMVLADGSTRTFDSTSPDGLHAAQVNIGALGVVTSVRLGTVPAFRLHQSGEGMSFAALKERLPDLLTAEHFDFLYDLHADGVWARTTTKADASLRNRNRVRGFVEDVVFESYVYGGLSVVSRHSPDKLGARFGKLPASSRVNFADRSDRVFVTPRKWPMISGEFAIPIEHALDAAEEVAKAARQRDLHAGFPLMVRFVAGDQAHLSPAHGRTSAYLCAIVTRPLPLQPYIDVVEQVCRQYGARPHWAKIHNYTSEELRSLYPRFDDFVTLRKELDPTGTFDNAYLQRVLGALDREGRVAGDTLKASS